MEEVERTAGTLKPSEDRPQNNEDFDMDIGGRSQGANEDIQNTALSQSSGVTTLTPSRPHSHSSKHTHLVCNNFHTQIMIGTHSASAAQVANLRFWVS